MLNDLHEDDLNPPDIPETVVGDFASSVPPKGMCEEEQKASPFSPLYRGKNVISHKPFGGTEGEKSPTYILGRFGGQTLSIRESFAMTLGWGQQSFSVEPPFFVRPHI